MRIEFSPAEDHPNWDHPDRDDPDRPTESPLISPAQRSRAVVAVVGAGVAGAATARALARRGVSVRWYESEPTLARHSSGRNAGLIRQAASDPVIATLCREGAAALRADGAPVRWSSSILLDPDDTISPELRRAISAEAISPASLEARFPWLCGARLAGAFVTPGDGIVDAPSLVERWRKEAIAAGAILQLGTPVTSPEGRGGRVESIRVAGEKIAIDALVVATGAWGAEWGEPAGVPIALHRTHRSLLSGPFSAAGESATDDLPWVWHLREGWYVRPDGEGGLWSAGEELSSTTIPAPRDPGAESRLHRVGEEHLPALTWGPVHWRSTGHRTFLPDRRFLLGEDPRCRGWHWVVGLGGHGVTSALAVAERVAAGLVEGKPIEPELQFRPAVLPGASVAAPVSRGSSEAVR